MRILARGNVEAVLQAQVNVAMTFKASCSEISMLHAMLTRPKERKKFIPAYRIEAKPEF